MALGRGGERVSGVPKEERGYYMGVGGGGGGGRTQANTTRHAMLHPGIIPVKRNCSASAMRAITSAGNDLDCHSWLNRRAFMLSRCLGCVESSTYTTGVAPSVGVAPEDGDGAW